jgi:hypothetical protein
MSAQRFDAALDVEAPRAQRLEHAGLGLEAHVLGVHHLVGEEIEPA